MNTNKVAVLGGEVLELSLLILQLLMEVMYIFGSEIQNKPLESTPKVQILRYHPELQLSQISMHLKI